LILVSACLMGQGCRYDARLCPERGLRKILKDQPHIALCPEIMGGLDIPRRPATISGARPGDDGREVLSGKAKVLDDQGRDVTPEFVAGAVLARDIALKAGVTLAYLKDRSPSCGYDPQGLNPQKGPGMGVLSALLLESGIRIIEVRAQAVPDME
jgi:uncharacterized protein YbbK (DUF523 family)